MICYLATRYSARVHVLLVGWNSVAAIFVASADFRNEVVGLQRTLHLPTWTLALFTGLINITITYRSWQKQR